jgi:zinc/manganese transport system ATP-binding protein
MRARDVVRLGIDGHRWGPPLPNSRAASRVQDLLVEVGADAYADQPVHRLSGGEQQRLRVAQALANDPALLLCDEPLLTLDLNHQRAVVDQIDRRRQAGTAVLFVTHEINPVIRYVDRVLYLVAGRFRLGPVQDVLTSATLSQLYGTPVEVVRFHDRLVVLGADDLNGGHDEHYGHDPHGTHTKIVDAPSPTRPVGTRW